MHPRQPLLWGAIAFAVGIFIGSHASPTSLLWMIAAVVLGSSGIFFLRARVGPAFIVILGVTFVSGAVLIQLRPAIDAAKAQILPFANGNDVIVSGHVTREGFLQEKDFGEDVQKVDIETDQIVADGTTSQIRSGLRITISSKQVESATAANLQKSTVTDIFRYGERLRLPVKLSLPRNFRNPGAFDYEGYLAENGIAALGSVKLQDVKCLPGFSGSRAELWRTRVHRSLIKKIQALWPANQAALVDTVLLGDNNLLGVETRTDFQRTGTYHVLVVSGLMVGILALVNFCIVIWLGF
jgi:competence protein ComEC